MTDPIMLSAEQTQRLIMASRACTQRLKELDSLEACGVDCEERRSVVEATLAKCSALLEHFGIDQIKSVGKTAKAKKGA